MSNIDWPAVALAVLVIVAVAIVNFAYSDYPAIWVRECAQARPLAECRIDAAELFQ